MRRLTIALTTLGLCFAQSLQQPQQIGNKWSADFWSYGLTKSKQAKLATLKGGGVVFDYPLSDSGWFVAYVTTQLYQGRMMVDESAARQVVITVNLAVTGTPQFNYMSEPGNTCNP